MHRIVLAILLFAVLFGCKSSETAPQRAQFVFVKIPEELQPLDRAAKYEDPLDATLKKEGVGEVSGGGTQMSAPDASGKRSIESVGIDVDLSDFDTGMPILKRELLRLGAPPNTVLKYTRDGKELEEKLR